MKTGPKDDDAPLVESCIRRDAAAWGALVERYSPLIAVSITNRLKKYGFNPSCEDTDDIRQNLLVSIWASGKLEKVRNRHNIAYWLSIVSGNAAIEHMRRKMVAESVTLVPITDTEDAEAIPAAAQTAYDTAPEPEPRDKEGLLEAIERSVEKLPPKEQLVIKLNIIHEMGYREIAEMLDMPTGTVSSYIKRAKDKLKEELVNFFPPGI